MPYANPRGQALTDIGWTITTLCACTLADYTSGGTQTPLVDDSVTFSATGDWYAKRAPNGQTKMLGRVLKVELAPVGTSVGYITVEWFDILGFRECTVSNLANVTRGNSAIKAGADTVAADFNAQATTGNLIVVAKSAASGAGTCVAAVVA